MPSRATPPEVNEEGWPRIVRSVLSRAGKTEADVDLWLWTQVNLSTIRAVMDRLQQPMEVSNLLWQRIQQVFSIIHQPHNAPLWAGIT